jgi:hypothetical protein
MLKLKAISQNAQVNINFDFYTPINIDFEEKNSDQERVHCYELSDTNNKSLLEIAIGAISGNIKYITLVIPPGIRSNKQLIANSTINEIEGLPSFETKNWTQDDLYTNVKTDFNIYFDTKSISFVLHPNKTTMKIINDRIVFGFDANNILCSIEIMNIAVSERKLFEESLKAKNAL